MTLERKFQIPRWAVPILKPSIFKGAKGGRASGKSHYFAERIVEKHECNPDFKTICCREVQKSIRHSSYQLIMDKIKKAGLSDYFKPVKGEIRDLRGEGVLVFEGLQDHTSDSIKSYEGFDLAWGEEAQRLSKYSLDLLTPTILRKPGAECWFSWNPDQPEDAIETLSRDPDFKLVAPNYYDNPWCPDIVYHQAEKLRRLDPDGYAWIYGGGFNVRSKAQIFAGKWVIEDFDERNLGHPLFGLDFGFSQDPTAGVEIYIHDETLYIRREAGKIGLELDDTADYLISRLSRIKHYSCLADCSRPESIKHVSKKLPRLKAAFKWSGSVEDGIAFMRSFKRIVIHPDCTETADEFRLYSYKIDKRTQEPTPDIVDKFNHYIDAIRYALQPLIRSKPEPRIRSI